ncbi:TauD/TfdA dioxygenase family protein [Marinomonas posidonica]|uniref:Taurine dioxygenase n=1 Tax=Marinomonas posidonica (strain CECT 7376 / NCIMB 14433 / IVIA-Po-181) TaxID=491952 RepID=F6CV06_MARPP|nr:TauD/TfdA family dioxygenase [Marinomonas posidonica]AEF55332.1 Taurine dioxygenase [Marinomonas posidonica IVIA-Po-181]
MKIVPLSPSIGALVEGVVLSALSEAEFGVLYQAFLQHKVLFFHDQALTVNEHLALAERFGELEAAHPFFPHLQEDNRVVVIETARGNPPGKSYWHTDMTWQSVPPTCSILHAQYVPQQGGDTIWCDMAAVWSDLSSAEQAELRSLNGIHALHAFAGSRYDHQDEKGDSVIRQRAQEFPPQLRPIRQTHPETQQEMLFINEQFTRAIEGMTEQASQQRLATLFAKARQEKYQVRFAWQQGSVAIWDNRVTQHFAVTDYGDEPRRLHRVTVKGDPVFAGIAVNNGCED